MASQAELNVQKLLEQFEALPAPGRYGALAGVVVVVLGLYYFTMFGPVQANLRSSQQQLAKLQGEIAEARAVVANLDGFRTRSEELAKKYETARERLPNATELPVLLTDISSLGKKSGLEFRKFRPADEVRRGFYAEVPISVEFSGTYHDIAVFFDRLSKLSRIVNISEFAMTLRTESGEAPVLNVSGVARTFRFIESSEAPPATKKRGKEGA
jgi:type IV pilus assembly protein PilO